MTSKRLFLIAAWVCAGATVAGLFLPWAHLSLRDSSTMQQWGTGRIAVKIRRGADTISGDLPSPADIPRQVTGAQIPQLANQGKAKVAVALFELFTEQRQRLGLKSYAVYLIPGIALLCAVLLTVWGQARAVAFGVAVGCALVAGLGLWKLLTADTKTLFVAITIGHGLWLSLWSYLGLSVAAIGYSVGGQAKR